MSSNRLDAGGDIDRSRPLQFQFNGKTYRGYAGDTLASALLANGVRLLARSFKYHRPRGIYAAGGEEPNALVQVGTGARSATNLKATQVELTDGLIAKSINCWPSPQFDLHSLHQVVAALMPAGFYYKTFMRPNWHVFEGAIRRAAGLGIAPDEHDPDHYAITHATTDVLVVGGGPSGLAAAQAAALSGANVILADDQDRLGGSLRWRPLGWTDAEASAWRSGVIQQLASLRNVTLLPRTTVIGYYDHDSLTAVEKCVDGSARERLWKLRARKVILATGATERPLVFADNDRPGVMLADAALQYLRRFGVLCGRNIVLFTNNNLAYHAALAFKQAGATVTIVDATPQPTHALHSELRSSGVEILSDSIIESTHGSRSVHAVSVVGPQGRRRIRCDLLCVSGGWSPNVHLHSQSGGSLKFDDQRAMFVPDRSVQQSACVGSANGTLSLADSLTEGAAAGRTAAQALGFDSPTPELPRVSQHHAFHLHPLWGAAATHGKAFVDFASDVTANDVALAARENYISVEHLKRYTTLGMGVDQGRTSNVNGLALLGELTGRKPAQVGTTRFRPPFSPVTFGAVAGWTAGDLYRPIKYLPAHEWHMAQGAQFEEFGGWLRPTAYPQQGEDWEAASLREARHVRQSVGIFDGSSLGKIEVVGPDAAAFLDRIYVGTASTLAVRRTRYGLMLNENGVIIDDGVFARLAPDRFLVHTTSGGADRINEWLEDWLQCEFVDLDAVIAPVTTQWATITVSGPRSRELLQSLHTDIDLSAASFPHMSIREGQLDGITARICRISFTGELSYEINVPASQASQLIHLLWAAGKKFDLAPYGIEALMTLRAEKGYLHIGVDTDGTTLPGDVGMGATIARKQIDFVGRRSLARPASLDQGRLQLVGLSSEELLPLGAQVAGSEASEGHVTTSVFSPALSRPIALALVRNGHQRMNSQIQVYHLGRLLPASIVPTTFFDPAGERLHA